MVDLFSTNHFTRESLSAGHGGPERALNPLIRPALSGLPGPRRPLPGAAGRNGAAAARGTPPGAVGAKAALSEWHAAGIT